MAVEITGDIFESLDPREEADAYKSLVSLLGEYSEKLRKFQDMDQKFRLFFLLMLMILLYVIFLLCELFPLIRINVASNPSASLTVTIFVMMTVVSISLSVASAYSSITKYEMNARYTAQRLERIVRSASQYADHYKLNFAQRLELDLKLADAEVLIQSVRRR